jgi:hypothetical protein
MTGATLTTGVLMMSETFNGYRPCVKMSNCSLSCGPIFHIDRSQYRPSALTLNVTERLWEMSDIVDVLEAWEAI